MNIMENVISGKKNEVKYKNMENTEKNMDIVIL